LAQPDPVFDPIAANIVTLDTERAAEEVSEIFTGSALASADSSEFSLIRSVLFNYPNGTTAAPPTPAGLVDPTTIPIPVTANSSNVQTATVINAGGLAELSMPRILLSWNIPTVCRCRLSPGANSR
jgi:hypothetical protein